jgi:hypothetical protein
MQRKQQNQEIIDFRAFPVHAEDNRLAKRLFQLEGRITALENRVEEMNEMLQMLIVVDAFQEREGDLTVSFCDCDEDDEEDEDEEEF